MGSVKGRRNFNRCKIKAIEFSLGFKTKDDDGNLWSSLKPATGEVYVKKDAKLDCPRVRLEEGRGIKSALYDERVNAIADLREVAAVAICSTCTFAKLSPIEAEEQETKQLQARSARLAAHAEMKKTEQETKAIEVEIQKELEGITTKFVGET